MAQQEVKGLRELGEFLLHTLPDSMVRRDNNRAAFAAAQVFQDEAAALVHIKSGNLHDHIAIFKQRGGNPMIADYRVGVRKIKLNLKERKALRIIRRVASVAVATGDAFYWYYLEFGFHPHGGSVRVQYPFLRPAFDSKTSQAIEAHRRSLADSVQRVASTAKV